MNQLAYSSQRVLTIRFCRDSPHHERPRTAKTRHVTLVPTMTFVGFEWLGLAAPVLMFMLLVLLPPLLLPLGEEPWVGVEAGSDGLLAGDASW
jgi:hypothetical protein